jgi:hypothetical protein
MKWYQSCDGVTEIGDGIALLRSIRSTIAIANTARHARAKIKSKVCQHWWILAPIMPYNISTMTLLEFQHWSLLAERDDCKAERRDGPRKLFLHKEGGPL